MNKELISKNYLYVSNAIKESHFLECRLFSNYSVLSFCFWKSLLQSYLCFNQITIIIGV